MGEESGYRWPYDRTPGGSMPPPDTHPAEGLGDLTAFTILSLLSTTIIAIVGLMAWMLVQ